MRSTGEKQRPYERALLQARRVVAELEMLGER
jgi:hypothetical protein